MVATALIAHVSFCPENAPPPICTSVNCKTLNSLSAGFVNVQKPSSLSNVGLSCKLLPSAPLSYSTFWKLFFACVKSALVLTVVAMAQPLKKIAIARNTAPVIIKAFTVFFFLCSGVSFFFSFLAFADFLPLYSPRIPSTFSSEDCSFTLTPSVCSISSCTDFSSAFLISSLIFASLSLLYNLFIFLRIAERFFIFHSSQQSFFSKLWSRINTTSAPVLSKTSLLISSGSTSSPL